ncbi:hypothetical protein ACA30_13215 [Virgibacillus soli]|uniref:Uncharacterized protein n=1 Tax=Lederbergia galactosidilytica TaxID=217031 RepID=A0A0Q9YKR3_9BACI|nr:hypothetical protein ACA30_13215 [Virgibacillus soli]KRG16851.1 hypothetical protein ACA29_02930 [Lederbergia galactosidilytica]
MNNNPLNNRERYFRQLKGRARGSDVRGRYFMNIILILFFFIIIGSVVFFVKIAQGPMDDMKEPMKIIQILIQ